MTLDEALEYVFTGDADENHDACNGGNLHGVLGWFYVGTEDAGVIAYFHSEADAMRFRLSYINGLLNPVAPALTKGD